MGDIETATGDKPMQDIATDLEARLYGPETEEPTVDATDEEALEDEEILPSDDDSDSEDDEGSDELEDDGEDEIDEGQTLAEYLGVDEDRIKYGDDGSISLESIVDGEKKDVSLKELVSSYQLQGHVNNKSISLENERKQFSEEQKSVSAELLQRADRLESMSKILEDQLVQEYQSIDWDRLRVDNPSEWSAMRQEYAERAQSIQASQEQILAEKATLAEEEKVKQQYAMQQYAAEQMQKVIADNPTWADESVRSSDLKDMRNFLSNEYGFSESDMLQVGDYRLINIIKDARKFKDGIKKVEEKKQKLVPKFKKPGAAKANRQQLASARDTKAKRARVKSSGKTADVASLILDRM